MELEKLKKELCYYDNRNPDNCVDKSDLTESELNKPQIKFEDYATVLCSCDNCFYGRTELADYILNIMTKQEKLKQKLEEDYPIYDRFKYDEDWVEDVEKRRDDFSKGVKWCLEI